MPNGHKFGLEELRHIAASADVDDSTVGRMTLALVADIEAKNEEYRKSSDNERTIMRQHNEEINKKLDELSAKLSKMEEKITSNWTVEIGFLISKYPKLSIIFAVLIGGVMYFSTWNSVRRAVLLLAARWLDIPIEFVDAIAPVAPSAPTPTVFP